LAYGRTATFKNNVWFDVMYDTHHGFSGRLLKN
jgi:hypothetical protein